MAPMGATKFAAPVRGVVPAGFTASLDAWLGVATQKLADGTDDPDFTLPVRAHDAVAAMGTAVFHAASFLVTKAGGYDTLDDQTFTYDPSGHLQGAGRARRQSRRQRQAGLTDEAVLPCGWRA